MNNRTKNLSQDKVQHLAWLARIELSKKEEDLFAHQLNDILEYFRKIDEPSTEDVPPTYHVFDLTNVWRSDEVRSFSSEKILRNTPQVKDKYVKGPRMG